MAVQVERMKPELKEPGTILLTLKCTDEPLSTLKFKFNLRRYTEEEFPVFRWEAAGAYTHRLFSST
jgi:hypothetical protein